MYKHFINLFQAVLNNNNYVSTFKKIKHFKLTTKFKDFYLNYKIFFLFFFGILIYIKKI